MRRRCGVGGGVGCEEVVDYWKSGISTCFAREYDERTGFFGLELGIVLPCELGVAHGAAWRSRGECGVMQVVKLLSTENSAHSVSACLCAFFRARSLVSQVKASFQLSVIRSSAHSPSTMLARTSLRSLLRPAARPAAASARWYSEKTPEESQAEHVQETVDKVESAAEDILKKVTDLEAQVKDLKVSLSSCCGFLWLTLIAEPNHVRTSGFHQPSTPYRTGKSVHQGLCDSGLCIRPALYR